MTYVYEFFKNFQNTCRAFYFYVITQILPGKPKTSASFFLSTYSEHENGVRSGRGIKSESRVQIQDDAICISLRTNVLGQGTQPISHVPQEAALSPTCKIFSLRFDVDCEEVPIQLQMELIYLQCSEDLKNKFPACHILDFRKRHIEMTHQVMRIYTPTYCYEQMFSKMKHAKSMLYAQNIITCLMYNSCQPSG